MLPPYMFDTFIEIHNFLVGCSTALIISYLHHRGYTKYAALLVFLLTGIAIIAWGYTWKTHSWYFLVPFAVILTVDRLVTIR